MHGRLAVTLIIMLLLSPAASGVVFINEVFINPDGSYDGTREYLELMGTPGKSLDGYAVAFVNGYEDKYWPLGSIPPVPTAQEIDEFFSLDGLSLGANGILVLGVYPSVYYPTLLDDSNFQRWNTVWDGPYDVPGKLQNDGANTVLLIRNRPGATEADPSNPLGNLWVKDSVPDGELVTPVEDSQDGQMKDQYGNGNLDKGDADGMGGFTNDFKGASTPEDVSDDLEVVDELSYEHGRGWEYDVDGRHVDSGSVHGGLPYRHVHALDDPQGFNPDALTRVDYRTKGAGWSPVSGAVGEMLNGNNWQDTATEQWIRGEAVVGSGGVGGMPQFFYSVAVNVNPEAIQPYETNVPLWLDDGGGDNFNFSASDYQLMAGRINPLAVPFIPGDVDRDGDCDADDIAKVAAVFGNGDWIFSNSFGSSPEGDDGDPAYQTRPWDVDATGSDGVESSDLQWTLNFQGSSNGRVKGIQYDDVAGASSGVALNDAASVECHVSYLCDEEIVMGEIVEVVVSAQIMSGGNVQVDEENGVMQFTHDVIVEPVGILELHDVQAVEPYTITRPGIITCAGTNGVYSIGSVNGYTTSFVEGLAGPAGLYLVRLQTVGFGNATVEVRPAAQTGLAVAAPGGIKIGHCSNNGNPGNVVYSESISVGVFSVADIDRDGDADEDDYAMFADCFAGPGDESLGSGCDAADLDDDLDVDLADFAIFSGAYGR